MPDATIRAAAEGVPIDINALELDIRNLVCMTKILADLLDDYFAPRSDALSSYSTCDTIDMVGFAWNDVVIRAERLKSSFETVQRGRVAE